MNIQNNIIEPKKQKKGNKAMVAVWWILGIIVGLFLLFVIIPWFFIGGLMIFDDVAKQSNAPVSEFKSYSWDKIYFAVGQKNTIQKDGSADRKLVLLSRPLNRVSLCQNNYENKDLAFESRTQNNKITVNLKPMATGGNCRKNYGEMKDDPRFLVLEVPLTGQSIDVEIVENQNKATFSVLINDKEGKMTIVTKENTNNFALVPFPEMPIISKLYYVIKEKTDKTVFKDTLSWDHALTLFKGSTFTFLAQNASGKGYELKPNLQSGISENTINMVFNDLDKNLDIYGFELEQEYKRQEDAGTIGLAQAIYNPVTPAEVFSSIKKYLIDPADIKYFKIIEYSVDGAKKTYGGQ